MNNFSSAIAAYTKAIDIEPDNIGFRNNLANAYGDAGENDKAIKEYKRIIAIAPDYAKAYNNQAGVKASLFLITNKNKTNGKK